MYLRKGRHLDRSYSTICTVLNKKVRERVERSHVKIECSHYRCPRKIYPKGGRKGPDSVLHKRKFIYSHMSRTCPLEMTRC